MRNLVSMSASFKHAIKIRRQKGAVIILMAFILGLGAAAFLLKSYNVNNLQAAQDAKTHQVLGEAKQALIAWSVAHPNWPGVMPFPDRQEVMNANYDGKSDCVTTGLNVNHLLGKLPLLGDVPCITPHDGVGAEFLDVSGQRLWYAVSRNLIRVSDTANTPIINPISIENPIYPWLRVLDKNGLLISDRVAAVIIAPGNPVGFQNRSSTAPNPTEFLDTFQIGTNTYSNADYDAPDEDFVVGLDTRLVSAADTTYVAPYAFNDKLVFITIDELIKALNKRVASEAAILIQNYQVKNGHYPYAASLGSALNNHRSVGTNSNGMVPIDVTNSCSCTASTCSCSFNPITSVSFRRSSGTWNSLLDFGSCHSNGNTCVCNGAGFCRRGSRKFDCDGFGNCSHTGFPASPLNSYIYTVPNYADLTNATGNCTIASKKVTCTSTGNFDIGLNEPSWFKINFWQDFLYYEWSASAGLQLGTKTGLSAILVNAGNLTTSEIGRIQMRPSSDIRDYLDSVENTDGDLQFDSFNKPKTSQYNDQPFLVNP